MKRPEVPEQDAEGDGRRQVHDHLVAVLGLGLTIGLGVSIHGMIIVVHNGNPMVNSGNLMVN